jgi:hypothetical protein
MNLNTFGFEGVESEELKNASCIRGIVFEDSIFLVNWNRIQ